MYLYSSSTAVRLVRLVMNSVTSPLPVPPVTTVLTAVLAESTPSRLENNIQLSSLQFLSYLVSRPRSCFMSSALRSSGAGRQGGREKVSQLASDTSPPYRCQLIWLYSLQTV